MPFPAALAAFSHPPADLRVAAILKALIYYTYFNLIYTALN